MSAPHEDVAHALADAADGKRGAVNRLFELLYPELRQIAHARVRNDAQRRVLDTTSLINESYLRLVAATSITVENKNHFLSYAARVMRSVIVDTVRNGNSQRRGGGSAPLTLNTNLVDSIESPEQEIEALDGLLTELLQVDERLVRIVEMRYFAGLDNQEIAEVLGLSVRTVERDLAKVRLLLLYQPE